MAWGKARRFVLGTLLRRRAERGLSRRRGACNGCGACCKLVYKCPAFQETPTGGWCTIYDDRPGQCALFPMDERDLRDRDCVMPERPCGFSFVPEEEAPAAPESTVLKDTLSKLHGNPRRRRLVVSTLAIFLSGLRRRAPADK
jgi:hypothetical protein